MVPGLSHQAGHHDVATIENRLRSEPMADFTVPDGDAFERKVEARATEAAKRPEVRALLPLVRDVLGIPTRGFGRDERAFGHWRRALDHPARTRAVDEHPRLVELVEALPPAPTPSLPLRVPLLSPAFLLAWATRRVLQLGSLDNRFRVWAEYLIVTGRDDAGHIIAADDMYARALGDPQGRAFPPEMARRVLSDAVRQERNRLADACASSTEVNRCITALVRRKRRESDLSWTELTKTEEARAYLAATDKQQYPFKKQVEAVRNVVYGRLKKQR
jgi:hypothetical protein